MPRPSSYTTQTRVAGIHDLPGYTRLVVSTHAREYVLQSCNRCGAIVHYVTTHDAWHAALEHGRQP